MTTRMRVFGIEATKGTSMKSGAAKPYEMASIHVVVPLAPPMGDKEVNIAKGFMGSTYRVPYEVVKRIAHNSVPFDADVDIEAVMRFGKREDEVKDVRPVETVKKAA